ncbi:MAG: Gldg family protein [Desulfobacteraceae bacterium]|jgi:ABC-type uncharacterized transport system involved in gliding motility auxiliary subunit
MTEKKKGLQKSLYSVGGLILVLLIIVLLNLIASQIPFRWDATAEGTYSLSDGTKSLLADLKNDIVIKVFYTDDIANLPGHIKTFANRTLDFLSEYEYTSGGKITVEQYNPKPDSEEEEWAETYGLEKITLPSGEAVFFGMVALQADQEETIAFLDPNQEPNLEYDITRMISRVSNPHKNKIAIISSLPIFGTPPMGFNMPGQSQMPKWLFVAELEKTYDVTQVNPTDTSIDPETNLLILFHPKNLSDQLLYAVDQYVLKGGNLIVYADPLSVLDDPRSGGVSSNPKKLFDAWGISMDTNKVVGDFTLATSLRNQNNQPETNPLWLSTRPECFSSKEIITANLESTLMPVAGSLVKSKDSKYDFIPLIQSTPNASMVDGFKHTMGVDALRKDFAPDDKKYNLAAMIRGTFKTAFPDGAPKAAEDDNTTQNKNDEPGLKEGSKKSNIIVIADVDMLYDGYYVSKQNFLGFNVSNIFNDNLNLLLNSTEMLTGSEALIEIRSRGSFERPFTRVQDLEAKAQRRWLTREQDLVKKVDQTNAKLQQLEQQKDASQRAIISSEQEAEIKKFQEEKQRINQELKVVRRNLRADIEKLGATIKFINIFLMPFLVSLGGIIYALYLRNRTRKTV